MTWHARVWGEWRRRWVRWTGRRPRWPRRRFAADGELFSGLILGLAADVPPRGSAEHYIGEVARRLCAKQIHLNQTLVADDLANSAEAAQKVRRSEERAEGKGRKGVRTRNRCSRCRDRICHTRSPLRRRRNHHRHHNGTCYRNRHHGCCFYLVCAIHGCPRAQARRRTTIRLAGRMHCIRSAC